MSFVTLHKKNSDDRVQWLAPGLENRCNHTIDHSVLRHSAISIRTADREARQRSVIPLWRSTMETHTFPAFGTRPVAAISAADVIEFLKLIWYAKP